MTSDASSRPERNGNPLQRDLPFTYAELIDPQSEDLQAVEHQYQIDPALIEQMQDRSIVPGVAESANEVQALVRLDVPAGMADNQMSWERVDLLLGQDFVVVAQPRPLTTVRRAVVRASALHDPTSTEFAALLVAQVVDMYHLTLLSFERFMQRRGNRQGAGQSARGGVDNERAALLGDFDRSSRRLRRILEDLSGGLIAVMTKPARRQVRLTLDRLDTVEADIQRLRNQVGSTESPDSVSAERESALGAESPEVIETAAAVGERRLHRLNPAHAITALLGAFGVSFGAIAMSWTGGPWMQSLGFDRAQLIGALAFPIGFVIVMIGKGELFTENFFFPVTGVIRGRGSLRDLLELWGYVLFFNMVGSVISSYLMSRTGVLNSSSSAFLIHVANDKIGYTFWEAFMKAIFAGWLMTIMTWLILAATGMGPRLVVIWMTGYLIVAGHFNHVVISAPEIFTAMWLGAHITVGDWFIRNFVPALLGNLIGGVVFVTILGFAQAHTLEQSDRENDGRRQNGRRTRFWPE